MRYEYGAPLERGEGARAGTLAQRRVLVRAGSWSAHGSGSTPIFPAGAGLAGANGLGGQGPGTRPLYDGGLSPLPNGRLRHAPPAVPEKSFGVTPKSDGTSTRYDDGVLVPWVEAPQRLRGSKWNPALVGTRGTHTGLPRCRSAWWAVTLRQVSLGSHRQSASAAMGPAYSANQTRVRVDLSSIALPLGFLSILQPSSRAV